MKSILTEKSANENEVHSVNTENSKNSGSDKGAAVQFI